MADQPASLRKPLRGEIVFDRPAPPEAPAALLDWISFVMDRLFGIPGTRLRFGLNSFLMLLPILGDVIPSIVSFAILAVGLSNYRVPRIVAVRMLFNSLLDASLGWIPLFGDLFDLVFKADTRNVRLLQEYAGQGAHEPPSTWRHWVVVLGMLAVFAFVTTFMVLGAIWFVQLLVHALRGGTR